MFVRRVGAKIKTVVEAIHGQTHTKYKLNENEKSAAQYFNNTKSTSGTTILFLRNVLHCRRRRNFLTERTISTLLTEEMAEHAAASPLFSEIKVN